MSFGTKDDYTEKDTEAAILEGVQIIEEALPAIDETERKSKYGIFAEAEITVDSADKLITVILDKPLPGRTVATLTVDTGEAAARIFGALSEGLSSAVKKINVPFSI